MSLPARLPLSAHLVTVSLDPGVPVQLTDIAFLLALERGECRWPERFQITAKAGDAHVEIETDAGWVAKDLVLPLQPFRLRGTGMLQVTYYRPC